MAIGTGHRSNNYSESKMNDHLDNNRRQEQRNKDMVDTIIDLWNVLGTANQCKRRKERFLDNKSEDIDPVRAKTICLGTLVCWNSISNGSSGKRQDFKGSSNRDILEFKMFSHDFIPDERCVCIRPGGSAIGIRLQRFIRKFWWSVGNSVFTVMVSEGPMSHGRKDAEGPSLDESLENEEHLDVDSCDSDSPKNVNNDSVSPSSRVLREEDVRGVESDLVDSFEEGEIRDDSVLYNDGCIKDCMEKNLEDDAGEILGVHSQGDCGNVTTDDNEDVTPVIAPEKDSIIAPPSTPPGNDLNIAVESGSSWIDYIGPLTSDEIDSDKRWSYRDPNGNIHGLFSLAQLRSWKDYFPSDLQIWSYYGNVKEAILLHNALSRQTKDAG
ncbi:5-oxoprolinase-like protein [Tanacetum coccineum]